MNVHDPDLDPVAELRRAAALPFAEARAMPKAVYTSESFAAREIERIFRRDWVSVGRSSALAKPGDYLTCEIAGEPVMVLRDAEGRLRAQSNVCRHRMSTLLEGRGSTARITCPYHGWVYGLDGRLRGAPYMEGSRAFDRKAICLPQLRCTDWLGWTLLTLNPDAPEPSERLRDLEAEIAPYGMEHYIEAFRETFVWDTNWKILAENFMESYHLPVCHAGTIGGLSNIADSTFPEGAPAFNMHSIMKDPSFFLSVAHPTNTRLAGEWRLKTVLISIYPALLITLTPGYFWYLSLHPRGPARVHVTFGGGLAPEFAADPEGPQHFAALKRLLDAVNAEDKGCTERVFRGVNARHAAPGPLSRMERPLYDFMRYLAERVA
jgi:phenylpropionate dioxygenase-like ring-hydroxylating dioxygenase large terminal subunit